MLDYLAVGNCCAVHFASLRLPISDEEALAILVGKGFKVIDVDLLTLARSCLRTSRYRRGANPSEAPQVVDCSSFTQWLYGKRGIFLRRRSIQQMEKMVKTRSNELRCGDLLFTRGFRNYWRQNLSLAVGHVGFATGEGTVIHAANSQVGVFESKVSDFVTDGCLHVRRVIPYRAEVLTLMAPPKRRIDCSDDFRWIILQNLK